jgi:hypothetical protein
VQFCWGVGLRLARREEAPAAMWMTQHWTENLLVLNTVLGVVMLLLGRRVVGEPLIWLHYLYGSLFPLIAVVGGRIAGPAARAPRVHGARVGRVLRPGADAAGPADRLRRRTTWGHGGARPVARRCRRATATGKIPDDRRVVTGTRPPAWSAHDPPVRDHLRLPVPLRPQRQRARDRGPAHGADWDVEFLPHSLAQGHVEPGQPDVWDLEDPGAPPASLALQAGLAVRDHQPERFLDVHEALFAARHDHGRGPQGPRRRPRALLAAGRRRDTVFEAVIAGGEPLKALRAEHEAGVRDHEIWGVPTFVAGGRAVFARVLDRPDGDGELARRRIEQIVDLVVDAPMLHEFKQTDLPM